VFPVRYELDSYIYYLEGIQSFNGLTKHYAVKRESRYRSAHS
jgi:hypothetical protein